MSSFQTGSNVRGHTCVRNIPLSIHSLSSVVSMKSSLLAPVVTLTSHGPHQTKEMGSDFPVRTSLASRPLPRRTVTTRRVPSNFALFPPKLQWSLDTLVTLSPVFFFVFWTNMDLVDTSLRVTRVHHSRNLT